MDPLRMMNDYKRWASWAIWERDDSGFLTGKEAFPADAAIGVAHGRAMIVSLNPGSDWGSEPEKDIPEWANFHSPLKKHNDIFLAKAFVDTPYWGAYMVDLHPDIAESDSSLIRAKAAEVELAVRSLIVQAKLLGEVKTIVCVGGKSARSVKRHQPLIENELGIPDSEIKAILHYSRAAAGAHKHDPQQYRARVHKELGLV